MTQNTVILQPSLSFLPLPLCSQRRCLASGPGGMGGGGDYRSGWGIGGNGRSACREEAKERGYRREGTLRAALMARWRSENGGKVRKRLMAYNWWWGGTCEAELGSHESVMSTSQP